MTSYNKIILLGNVVRNPELRHTPGSNLPVARTSLAVNQKYKDKEEVMFIDIVVFGKQADILHSYATKGTPLLIDGRLSQNTWEQDGVKRFKYEVIVNNFQLMGTRRERVDEDNSNDSNTIQEKNSAFLGDIDDDDVSFPFQLP